ncbi:hypothetical protein [Nocardia brasiliensis]|uniref:hypothetical protein n=1 Tax=Nocardia brasiliensis TaxID=37326 RepID=UPI00245505FF|nr:hypothetical protein [Nocardia brasiliensis]
MAPLRTALDSKSRPNVLAMRKPRLGAAGDLSGALRISAGRVGLIYQLDSYDGNEPVVTPDEMERAVVLLKRTGDVDDDEWEEREEASRTRDAIIDEWRSAAQSQRMSLETIAAFPWLASWADVKLQNKAR